jgi:hypothetical protein
MASYAYIVTSNKFHVVFVERKTDCKNMRSITPELCNLKKYWQKVKCVSQRRVIELTLY